MEVREAWLEAPKAWLKAPEAWLEALEAWLEAHEAGGTDGRTDAAAQKGKKEKINGIEERESKNRGKPKKE